jgi:hypothetical protein
MHETDAPLAAHAGGCDPDGWREHQMASLSEWLITEEGKLVVAAVSGFLLATVASFSRGYFGGRGKTLATKHDIKDLQKQLEENTNITKRVERSYSREDVLWRSELDYRERQLSELYGPAYAIVKTESDIYNLWINGQMKEVNLQVKQYFHEHNNKITGLIISKAHLIEGATMPDCFVRFITDPVVFGLYAVPRNDGQVPDELAKHPRVQYPLDFNEHIIKTTEQLKSRIEFLHNKYAQPLA